MKVLSCAATRRRLHAFHDEELPVSDQIAVGAHLEWCDTCAASLAELRLVRVALREVAAGRRGLSNDEETSLQAGVVNRLNAERTVSWTAQAREMFDDMHLVYAGIGAATAAVVCVTIMLGMMRFATNEQPASVVAMVRALGSSNRDLAQLDARVRLNALDEAFSPLSSRGISGDSMFMLAAIVTREGTISNLELLNPSSGPAAPGTDEAKAAENLLGAVSRARFEPMRVDGLPIAVKMVWLVAHTTVRASLPLIPKKRTAFLNAAPPAKLVFA